MHLLHTDEHNKYVALMEEHIRLQRRIIAMQEEQISVHEHFAELQRQQFEEDPSPA